ncbi:MAG: hypothetical protein Q8P46_17950 [Hyphomicrobiales bacterium]|nr:hypothetical protein [Hyphomicrobiales bacterium]
MSDRSERTATAAAENTLKNYSKPTLSKGLVLSRITALVLASGITDAGE